MIPPRFSGAIKTFLSDRFVTVGIIVLSIAARSLQLLYLFNIRVDMSFQMIATQNLVNGNGVSLSRAMPADLSRTVYEPLVNWPPGFSFLLAPVYWLAGCDYAVSGILLQLVAAIMLIFYSRGILQLLELPVYLVNLYSLLTTFFIYSFYTTISSDAIAVSFFIMATYYAIGIVKSHHRFYAKTGMMFLALLVCASLKYLFIPVVCVVPLFFIVRGMAIRSRKEFRLGWIGGLLLLAVVAAILLYQKQVSGSAVYISAPQRGIFVLNLLDFYPYLPASLIKPETLQELTGFNVLLLYQVVHVSTAAMLVAWIVWMLYRYRVRNFLPHQNFIWISFLSAFLLTGLLMALSLAVAKEVWEDRLWTYVQEARYYGVVVVMIQLGLFVYYRYGKAKKYLLIFLLIMSVESLRGLYFSANRVMKWNSEEYSWQYEQRFQEYAHSLIEKAGVEWGNPKSVVTGSVYYMNNRIALDSRIPVLNEVGSINHIASLNTKEPVSLLVVLHQRHINSYQPFLSTHGHAFAGKFDEFYFYTVYVKPH